MNAYPNPPADVDLCNLEACLSCGNPSDLDACAGGCGEALHRRCADRCEACGSVVCSACVDHWQEYPYCPTCLAATKEFDEGEYLAEELTLA
jgi:hypothetical protein